MEKSPTLKNQIENWLFDDNFTFTLINEPDHYFHFILNDKSPLKMVIEIFQEIKTSDLIVGFLTFVSKDITFKIYNFDNKRKLNFKNKIDAILSKIRVDNRIGMNVGFEIISEEGRYGAKYFVKTKAKECNKQRFLAMLDLTKNTGIQLDEFLYSEFNN